MFCRTAADSNLTALPDAIGSLANLEILYVRLAGWRAAAIGTVAVPPEAQRQCNEMQSGLTCRRVERTNVEFLPETIGAATKLRLLCGPTAAAKIRTRPVPRGCMLRPAHADLSRPFA